MVSSFAHTDHWLKPPPRFVKLNVDGACPPDDRLPTISTLIHDHDGFVLAGRARSIGCPRVSNCVEAHALCYGFQLVIESGYSRKLIESDSSSVITQFQQHSFDMSVLQFILPDAHQILVSHSDYMLRSIRHNANKADHTLANFASSSATAISFMHDYLSYLSIVIVNEFGHSFPLIGFKRFFNEVIGH
ncbi:uncharacterized protein LOC120206369 [Hibiscus syriacus]|uniref:uncharacterized protein LOC120206369 n=1 Tax=Hibiscus syriacus TaxID=106335 RepID=UPI001924805D|nr:uncharacterized protein LOC120206369 [Hibiscus syriacus]